MHKEPEVLFIQGMSIKKKYRRIIRIMYSAIVSCKMSGTKIEYYSEIGYKIRGTEQQEEQL